MKRLGLYRRVSTDQQDTASQEHAVSEWIARNRPGAAILVYSDEGISGKTTKRPGFQRLCADVEAGKIDEIIVYRLDRLSRDANTAMRLLLDWMQRDLSFISVNEPLLQLDKANPFRLVVLALLSTFGEMERQAISSRVKAGLAAAKARGVRLGAMPKLAQEQLIRAAELSAQGRTYREIAHELGVSAATICRILKREAGSDFIETNTGSEAP